MRVLRVAGVEEPFNLPWILAFERGLFEHLDCEVPFTLAPGGTGELIERLENGSADIATLLTSGAVTAISRGSTLRLHSRFTDSPLLWGIHVGADSEFETIEQLEGKRFAISRFGSGSDLMSHEMCDRFGWEITPEQIKVVGGLQGAIEALPGGDAEIFLWERFVTEPLVNQGVFRHVGDIPMPWPAFHNCVRGDLDEQAQALLDPIVDIVLDVAQELKSNTNSTVSIIRERYNMSETAAIEWLQRCDWPASRDLDYDSLGTVYERMLALKQFERPEHLTQPWMS